MASVSEVLKAYGPEYLRRYGKRMTAQQKKVLRAVMACRESALGQVRYRCVGCGAEQTIPRSCCNRHCPACQWQQQQAWLDRQHRLLLPCHYFLLTFTLPKELRSLAMQHPEVVYRALMRAASETLKEGATNDRFVGATDIGLLGVLHTWGRDLSYHPHAHFLVPGGGVDREGRWRCSRASVFVPEQVLERLFAGKLRALLAQAGLEASVPASVWRGRFVVDSKAVGSGQHALKYLAPYVSRGCVANWRVTWSCGSANLDDAMLDLQVKRSGSRRYRPMRLRVTEFIRRWLHHVVPSGLHRVRRYGFLSSSSRFDHEEILLLIAIALDKLHYLIGTQTLVMPTPPKLTCQECGGAMICLGITTAPLINPRAPP